MKKKSKTRSSKTRAPKSRPSKHRKHGGGNLKVDLRITPTSDLYTKKQFETSGEPMVEWKPSNPYYTFLCADPDSSEPSWLHWLVVNCTGGTPSTGTPLTPWEPPTPPTGIHRYFFSLYSHDHPLTVEAPETRSKFDTNAFVTQNNLKLVDQSIVRVKA